MYGKSFVIKYFQKRWHSKVLIYRTAYSGEANCFIRVFQHITSPLQYMSLIPYTVYLVKSCHIVCTHDSGLNSVTFLQLLNCLSDNFWFSICFFISSWNHPHLWFEGFRLATCLLRHIIFQSTLPLLSPFSSFLTFYCVWSFWPARQCFVMTNINRTLKRWINPKAPGI